VIDEKQSISYGLLSFNDPLGTFFVNYLEVQYILILNTIFYNVPVIDKSLADSMDDPPYGTALLVPTLIEYGLDLNCLDKDNRLDNLLLVLIPALNRTYIFLEL
jgi:hypothetical protein